MNNAMRGQVRLAAITHQSLGQDPLKDTSCLNGKEREGRTGSGWRAGLRGSQPTSPNPPFTLLRQSQGLAASGAPLKYISLFQACLNETFGLKNHTVCGSINTSSPTMATQQALLLAFSPSFSLAFFKLMFYSFQSLPHLPKSMLVSVVLIKTCPRVNIQIIMLIAL